MRHYNVHCFFFFDFPSFSLKRTEVKSYEGVRRNGWSTGLNRCTQYTQQCSNVYILTDVFALVKSFRDFSGKNSVHGANDDQHDRIGEGDHVTGIDVTVTNEQIVFSGWVMMHRFSWIDYHPDTVN